MFPFICILGEFGVPCTGVLTSYACTVGLNFTREYRLLIPRNDYTEHGVRDDPATEKVKLWSDVEHITTLIIICVGGANWLNHKMSMSGLRWIPRTKA